MKPSKEAEALILLRVARQARDEARVAWRRAGQSERTLRAAFRACVLAERCVRKAAKALAHDPRSAKLFADADKLKAAADDLKIRLVLVIEGPVEISPAPK